MNPFWTNLIIDVLLFVFVIDCLFMWLVILMQRSKQEGLGAAFGGGITESVFGAQTSSVLVKATVWAAALFFILSICLARLHAHRSALQNKESAVQQELTKPVVPTVAPVIAPTNTPAATPSHPASTWATPTPMGMPTNQPPAKPASH